MQTSIGQHELALVSPQVFSEQRMHKHWSVTLNMPTPPALVSVWRIMAEQYNRAIINNTNRSHHRPSVVLPLPTGSGKTQGTCVFASMQAEVNATVSNNKKPVGLVVVTRLIEEADNIAKTVNGLAGREVAVAHHTKSRAEDAAVYNADLLVITHQAFINATSSYGAQDFERWDRISNWRGGERLLFIIDEALANVVQSYRATSQNLNMVLRSIPHELRASFPSAIEKLETLETWLVAQEHKAEGEASRILWTEGLQDVSKEIRLLREALRATDFDPNLFQDGAQDDIEGILQDAEAAVASYAYYFKSGTQHSINSAAYLIPPGLPGLVILDATAPYDVLYPLLGDRVSIVPLPGNLRDYSNVTLHVGQTSSGLGKHVMEDKKQLRLPRLVQHLTDVLGPDRSVFLCVHKHSEALAQTFSKGETPDPQLSPTPAPDGPRLKLNIGHWGAVDGKNDWKDCDVAVIWGLPYMDQQRAINSVFATRGPQDTQWLRDNTHKHNPTMLNVIMQRHLSTSVVQAINRICCRRVIDEQGRCPVSNVYIMLPKNWQGDAIIGDIHASMPGIKEVPWEFKPDGPKVYAPRSNSANDAIITLMRGREPGLTPFPFIRRHLALTEKQVRRVKEQLLNATSNIAAALREIGVSYLVTGAGRGSKSFLMKA